MTAFDVAFVGSSPNALAAAARLARAGKRVVVVEPAERVGGPLATEAFAPGFHGNIGMPTASLDPEIATTLGIELDVVRRDSVTWLGSTTVTRRELPLPVAFAHAVELVRAIDRVTPPDLSSPSELAALGHRLLGLGERAMHDVLRLLFVSIRDFCAEAHLEEHDRALLAGVAARGRAAGPFAPGTLFGVLRQVALDDGLFRSSIRGGVQRLPQALADVVERAGAVVRTGVGAVTVDSDAGIATAVRLANGERIAATAVVSDLDARATFTRLISPADLEPEMKRGLRSLRYRGSVARIHLAVRELPRFPIDPVALRGTLVLAGSLADLERNWDDAKRGTLPARPYIELAIPTLDDPALAPDGRHVVDLWVQHVPPHADREVVLARAIDALSPYAPGIGDLILHHHVALPTDLATRFGLTEGQLYGGEISLEQSFMFRPFSGCVGYETPIRGLYLCGSAAHPGGYSGRSGWNLAGNLLQR